MVEAASWRVLQRTLRRALPGTISATAWC